MFDKLKICQNFYVKISLHTICGKVLAWRARWMGSQELIWGALKLNIWLNHVQTKLSEVTGLNLY